MASIAERLLSLKSEIEQAKLDKASCEGALKQNMERLKTEFQCRSLEQAKAKLETLKNQKQTLQNQIEKSMNNLEENYQW